jgi:hypothetical protein
MSKTGIQKEQMSALCTDMKWLKEQVSNHLKHHWVITIVLLTAVMGEALGFLALVIKHVFTAPRP